MHRPLIWTLALSTALMLAPASVAGRIAATPRLPAGWSHAEINVIVKGKPHTLVYDRGRVQAISPSSLTLREQDGNSQVINVSPGALLTIDGQPASIAQVRRAEIAITLRIDGADATIVTVRIPPAVAALIARQQARGAGGRNGSGVTTPTATTKGRRR